ncbi:MAG: hypothetical protein LQ344_004759 [Seirophora lacunosa]|nr:MAG: hypothetical protein LQ344_004759 [Seirophora lacunosa]
MASTTDTNSPTNQGLKSLRILCFGDSLTAGFSGYGYFHYPYATHIRKKLKEELPDTDAVVDVSGLSGDRVIAGQFLERIKAVSEKAKHTPYDWIIILGGTNDLGWSERPDNIYESLTVPFFTMNDTRRAMMWDDGLHLTMDGYEMMGNAIAVKLLELLQVAKDPLNTGPKKPPKSHDSQGANGDD